MCSILPASVRKRKCPLKTSVTTHETLGCAPQGSTLVYFRDKWREDPPKPPEASLHDHAESSPF
jgi:hypothetical protein